MYLCGAPLWVSADAEDEALEGTRVALQKSLNQLTEAAQAAAKLT